MMHHKEWILSHANLKIKQQKANRREPSWKEAAHPSEERSVPTNQVIQVLGKPFRVHQNVLKEQNKPKSQEHLQI